MAFVWVDGCDMYATGSDLSIRYETAIGDGYISVNTTGGRYGGGAITFADLATDWIWKQFIDTADEIAGNTVCVGFSFRTDSAATPVATVSIFNLFNSTRGSPNAQGVLSATDAIGVGLSTSGTLRISDFDGSSFEEQGGTTNICDGNWHWIEVRLKADPSNGIKQAYVDGSLEIDFTSSDTGSSAALSHITFATNTSHGAAWRIDDLMIWDDTTGSTGDKDADTDFPLGDSRIELLYPDGAGSNTDWTPSTGSNYQCVDEAQPNQTDYVSTTTAGHTDTYSFDNISGSPTTIHTVAVQIHAQDANSQGAQVRGVAYNSTSEGLGPIKSFTSAWQTKTSSIPRDPNTGSAWTESGVNSSEFGIERPST